ARLPMQAADGEIEIGRDPSRLRLRPEGARASEAQAEDGAVVYIDAYTATDAIVEMAADRFEAFLVLRDASAPHSFTWHVNLPERIRDTRFERSGGLAFRDAEQKTVLRAPPAYAVDARGARVPARLSWEDSRLSVELTATSLEYPVLLDPAFEKA